MLELAHQCARRDAAAQRRLYEHYGERLFRLAYRYVQDRMAAEDVTTEAFIKIFSSLPKASFEHVDQFEAWLRRILINEALGYLRKRKLWRGLETVTEHAAPCTDDDVLADLSVEEVLRHIAALPLGYRTVLQLYALDGYQHAEIAALLGISIGASKSQLSKARAYLKRRLQQCDLL